MKHFVSDNLVVLLATILALLLTTLTFHEEIT